MFVQFCKIASWTFPEQIQWEQLISGKMFATSRIININESNLERDQVNILLKRIVQCHEYLIIHCISWNYTKCSNKFLHDSQDIKNSPRIWFDIMSSIFCAIYFHLHSKYILTAFVCAAPASPRFAQSQSFTYTMTEVFVYWWISLQREKNVQSLDRKKLFSPRFQLYNISSDFIYEFWRIFALFIGKNFLFASISASGSEVDRNRTDYCSRLTIFQSVKVKNCETTTKKPKKKLQRKSRI